MLFTHSPGGTLLFLFHSPGGMGGRGLAMVLEFSLDIGLCFSFEFSLDMAGDDVSEDVSS